MRDNHWAVKCAVVFLILVTVVNLGVSIWSTLEFNRLTKDYKNSRQELSMTKGFKNVMDSFAKIAGNLSTDKPQINEEAITELQVKLQQFKSTAISTSIHMILSTIASLITTAILFVPKQIMQLIEKFIDIPYYSFNHYDNYDYDSVLKFKAIMIMVNIGILIQDIYGLSGTFKYL
ncbi:hypothetical protein MKX42_08135 [Paenibacillus sp. FSL R7-0204]|uniref:hypothetical protein n=1 Tax=Paenibacillus sp. FSL R7-0204 TaxID=2921675 RepID=UPI0030F7236A